MTLEHNGQVYPCTIGSDVIRDGMYLEVGVQADGTVPIFEIFYSDVTHDMTVSLFEHDVPLAILEAAIAMAREKLPPEN